MVKRNTILGLLLCILSFNLNAQNEFEVSRIRLGIGMSLLTQKSIPLEPEISEMLEILQSFEIFKTLEIISEEATQNSHKNINLFYEFDKRSALGIDFYFNKIDANVLMQTVDFPEGLLLNAKLSRTQFLLTYKYSFINRRKFRLYLGTSLGNSFLKVKADFTFLDNFENFEVDDINDIKPKEKVYLFLGTEYRFEKSKTAINLQFGLMPGVLQVGVVQYF